LNLGFILFHLGRFEEAVDEYQKTLQFAEKARKLTSSKRVFLLDALVDAYINLGRQNDAIDTANKAYDLARATGQEEMAQKLAQKLRFCYPINPDSSPALRK